MGKRDPDVSKESDAKSEPVDKTLKDFAFSEGVELYGVTSVETYAREFPDKPQPTRFLNNAESIVVIGLPFEPATVSTVLRPELAGMAGSSRSEQTPNYSSSAAARRWFIEEEKFVIYRELDLLGYRMAKFLRKRGWTSLHLSANKKDPHFLTAPFYHMPAMYLAGLGSLGLNCCILSPEFGPRFIATSIITDCPLEPSQPFRERLCTDCGRCVKMCPVQAIDGKEWKNVFACAAYGCCTTCIAICPVGGLKVTKA
jgi:epoxyqueuosine reductase QueG